MKHLFAGAIALAVLAAGAATAQTERPSPYPQGGYQQDQRPGYERGDGGYRHDAGYRHDHGRRACHWSHYYHHRVCRWYQ